MITKVGSICAHAIKALSHLILHSMDIFELLGPNDCPHGCVAVLWNYTEKTLA